MIILSIIYILLGIAILEIYNYNKALNTDIYSIKDIPMYIVTMLLWPIVILITILLYAKAATRALIKNITDSM